MSRASKILFVLAAAVVSTSTSFAANDQQARPDILLILLDDSGWTDFGCYGSEIETRNIDRLAEEGMRFTDCHSAAPNCSPSRAGLLTGRTPSRVGIYSYLPSKHVMHLREQEVTVAELLRDAGYRTGHFGKWHLTRLQQSQPQPSDHGFDYSLGTDNNASPSHHNPKNFVRNGESVGEMKGYSCQLVVDEALGWLTKAKQDDPQRPTFTCVWFHEPHTPIASPPELVKKYQSIYPEYSKKQATYYANIENVDRAVGKLMRGLRSLRMDESTLIFLTSDNGPLGDHSKVGLRGRKSHVWEGGHRVPGIFRWPGKIAAGTVCKEPICGVDFLPTACEIAGVDPPGDRVLDGTSVWPLLQGRTADFTRRHPLYWFFYRLTPAIAMRNGDWVLIADTDDAQRPKAHPLLREDIPKIKESRPNRFELYHLGEDLAQRTDVADEHPDILARMKRQLTAFHGQVIAEGPAWEIPADYGATSKKKIWTSD